MMCMVAWYTLCDHHAVVSPLIQPWSDLSFLRTGVPLEQVSWHVVVTTDASSMGKGATCKGQAALGSWTGPRLLWHINYHELLAVFLALRQFRPLLQDKHVLICTDNTMAVLYINRQGHNSPIISSSEVRHGSSRCVPSTFWGSSIVQPMHSHDSSCSPENSDSIIRWSS